MDKTELNKQKMEIDLFSDIQKVVNECVEANYGEYRLKADDVAIFMSYIAKEIGKYAVTDIQFYNGVISTEESYRTYLEKYNDLHKEYEDCKEIARKREEQLIRDRRVLMDLLSEKMEYIDRLIKQEV
ncbi:MAG: hypothetical protein ACRDD7_17155 [Peptostreptococcaceae bacterium]